MIRKACFARLNVCFSCQRFDWSGSKVKIRFKKACNHFESPIGRYFLLCMFLDRTLVDDVIDDALCLHITDGWTNEKPVSTILSELFRGEGTLACGETSNLRMTRWLGTTRMRRATTTAIVRGTPKYTRTDSAAVPPKFSSRSLKWVETSYCNFPTHSLFTIQIHEHVLTTVSKRQGVIKQLQP